ncbi:DNA cytosine methyltransferase [Streptomyces smyrnaeus]|uniref:DNA cytosine methyltransferase n=1 Tax=Streptomyces smyrnaeus TaxID=1387713 RepID=UPI0033D6F5E0
MDLHLGHRPRPRPPAPARHRGGSVTPRIGSLFTGTGALDLAVQDVYGGHLVWHSQFEPPDKHGRPDRHQWAAQILHRHWPTVPNLGDITAIDWHQVLADYGRPDIATGGFPCQDISSAGKRAGLIPGSRSGLWAHMARAISVLRPKLVIIENVEGLLSRKAHRDLGSDAEAVDEGPAGGVLRALGAVLGDPGHPRVRCGVGARGRIGGRRSPRPQASLHLRLASSCRHRGPRTRTGSGCTDRAASTCAQRFHFCRHLPTGTGRAASRI